MAQFCQCGSGLNNLGVSSCPSVMKTIKKHIFVSLYDEDGVRNSIPLSVLEANGGKLPDSYVNDKIKFGEDGSTEIFPLKKWYPTPNVYENFETSRTDTTTEELQSGTIIRIQNGVSTFKGELLQVDESLASRILSNGCADFGVFEIDKDGSIRGEVSADGLELYPIKINKGSLDSYSVGEVEGTSVQRVMVTFQYDGTVNEINLLKIDASQIETNMLQIASLIDGEIVGTKGQTQSPTTLYLDYFVKYGGSFGNPIAIQGKTDPAADWSIFNKTQSAIVTASSIVEDVKGQYVFTVTGVASADVLEVQGLPEQGGSASDQDFESNTYSITIP